MHHGRDGDEHAGEPAAHVAADDAGEEGAFHAKVEGGVGPGGHADGDSGGEDGGEPQGEADTLAESPFLPQQHLLYRGGTHTETGDGSRDANSNQQRDQVLFHLSFIIMELDGNRRGPRSIESS